MLLPRSPSVANATAPSRREPLVTSPDASKRAGSSGGGVMPARESAAPTCKGKVKIWYAPARRLEQGQLNAKSRLERRGESRGGRRPGLNSASPSGPREVGLARRALSMLALMARSLRLALRLAWAGMLLSREREKRGSRKVKQHKASPPARLLSIHARSCSFCLFLCGCVSCFSNPGGFSKGAWGFVPAGTGQGFHPCTPPGPPRPWTPPGALAPGPFLAFTPCQILQPML